jgi:hypothetical protein
MLDTSSNIYPFGRNMLISINIYATLLFGSIRRIQHTPKKGYLYREERSTRKVVLSIRTKKKRLFKQFLVSRFFFVSLFAWC